MTHETEGLLPVIRPVWFLFLDILDDPVYVWTGTVPWASPASPDPLISGKTFLPLNGLLDIGDIVDQRGGGTPLAITLSGVDPAEFGFSQFIAQRRLWKKRRGVLWAGYAHPDGQPKYAPKRKRTGRMNDMTFSNDESSEIVLQIEGFAAHASRALNTRWVEQAEIDADDNSQSFAHDLANKSIDIGKTGQSVSGGGGSGGSDHRDTHGNVQMSLE